jgi:hypothetical protein
MQELSKLEDEERALFGFDLSNYTAAKEIKDAESPWLSPYIHIAAWFLLHCLMLYFQNLS